MKKLFILCSICIGFIRVQSQSFLFADFVDIGNIKARVGVHGNLWDDTTGNGNCNFPKGSGTHIAYSGALWLAGYDNGNLKAAANLYQVEFSPGPIIDPNNPVISHAEASKWDKIWKVNRVDINTFLATTPHTVANTPSSILDWPGRGNTHATANGGGTLFSPINDYNREFAPFIDVDGNGVYNPLAGDYPEIIGDQGLWMIFNDVMEPHTITWSAALGVEIHLLAYAYNRNSLADNIIFYNYKINNRSNSQLDSFKIGFFADMDLGHPGDDFVGYDSSRNLAITYNATSIDGGSGSSSYGATIPKVGVQILKMPGMTCDVFKPVGSFMYFNNMGAGFPSATLEPTTAAEFYYYMSSSFRNGQHLNNDFIGPGVPSSGLGSGAIARYAFDGDITAPNEWSECVSANIAYDRKMVIATDTLTFKSGDVVDFSIALLASNPSANNGCPTATFADIREVADTAKKIFCNPLPPVVTNTSDVVFSSDLKIFPNPVTQQLFVALPNSGDFDLNILDALGRRVDIPIHSNANTVTLETVSLPTGVYTLHLKTSDKMYVTKFLKN